MAAAKSKTGSKTGKKKITINEAIKSLDSAIKIMKKGQYDKAKKLLEGLKDEYAQDLELKGKTTTLIKICDKSLDKPDKPFDSSASTDPVELFNIGVFLHNSGEYKEALKCFEKGLKKSKDNADHYYYAMAASKARLEDFDGALADLAKSFEISQENYFRVQNDPDFAPLREQEELWEQVVAEGEKDD